MEFKLLSRKGGRQTLLDPCNYSVCMSIAADGLHASYYNIHSHGGWIVDGFPMSRDHWAAMTDQKLLPDCVFVLTDEEVPAHHLLSRFTQQKGLPDPSTFKDKDAEAKDEV